MARGEGEGDEGVGGVDCEVEEVGGEGEGAQESVHALWGVDRLAGAGAGWEDGH